jgi:PAS domain S-box-containing protein
VVVVVVVVASLSAFKHSETAAQLRKNTFDTIIQSGNLLSELKDAETGQRGYLLTGDVIFLESYTAVRDGIHNHLEKLQTLTLSAEAQKHLATLKPLMDAKLAELAHTIDLRQHNDMKAALKAVAEGKGKRLMDLTRVQINAFIAIEEKALAQHDTKLQSSMQQLLAIIVASGMLMLLFALSFSYFMYRRSQQLLKNAVHLETRHLLALQEQMNRTLQHTNWALEISEQKLAVTLNSIGDAVIATDTDGRVTFLNPVSAQLTGWAQSEAIGRPVGEIFHIINKDTRQLALIPVMDALAYGTVQGLANHTVLIARDGSEYDICDSCAPIRDREQTIVGAVLIFRDVTEEYGLQKALNDSSVVVQTILNTVVDGIITFHACGGIIETVNPAIEKMFGYSAAELTDKSFGLLVPELDEDKCRLCLNFNARDKMHSTGFQQEVTGHRKDGSYFTLEIALGEMELSGRHYFTGILRDITVSKKLAEDSRRFFALSQEMLCVAGFDGYFKSLNSSWIKNLGYTLTELLDKPFIEFIHPNDRQATQDLVKRLVNGDSCTTFQNRYVCKDGSFRYFSWDITTVIQEQLFYCSARDITARIHGETEQKRQHERAQLALDAGMLGDWSWDAVSDQVSLGVLAAHIFGFPEGGHVTRAQLRERLTQEDAEYERMAWDKALGEHSDYRNEYRVKHPIGGACWIAITGRGNYAADGTVLGMNGVVQDINGRKLAELEKLRLAAIVESSDDAIISKDLQGIITSWNAGAESIFGYSAAEIIGKPITKLMPTQRQMEHSTIIGEINKGLKVNHFETVRLRKDGSCVDISVTVSPIKDASGVIIGASKVARDITYRKHAEAKLLEAVAAAEKANLAKSEFLSSMSHELRTPLNAILGFSQLLETGNPLPTASQMIRLQEIIKAGWYLLGLINEVLDLSLIESGKLLLLPEPVLLMDVLLECVAMIEPQAQQHAIKITLFPFDNSWVVSADRTRVKQVLLNLLSNAVKYNSQPGTVEVICAEITLGYIRIAVKDSGVGLPAEKLAQLFQPFNRLGQEHGSEEGTGIGLVVTKKLVELMGGNIGVESTVGEGSVFWVEFLKGMALPMDDQMANLTKWVAPVPEQPALYTLLYVEDNPANLMLVEQIIADYPDIRLLSAPDANMGIALARAHLPEVVLMDITLPGISGSQAMKLLRKDPATAHIPVIALTANAMPNDIKNGLEAGFFRYLTKPIKVSEFMTMLNEALAFSKEKPQPIK